MEATTVQSNGVAATPAQIPTPPAAAAPAQPTTPAQGVTLTQEQYEQLMAARQPAINFFNPQAAAHVANKTGELAGTVVQSGVVVVTGFLGGFFQGLSKK